MNPGEGQRLGSWVSPYDEDRLLRSALIGRVVVWVEGSTLFLDTGLAVEFELTGGCCSVSAYTPEGLQAFLELRGAKILEIEDRTNESPEIQSQTYPPGEHDTDCWHFLVFKTDRGHVTIDWRNTSNGYYDGSVLCSRVEGLHPAALDAALKQNYGAVRLLRSP